MKVKNGIASSSAPCSSEMIREHLVDEIAEKVRLDQAKLDADEAEEQSDGGERERRRIAEQHENDQPREHQGRHVAAYEFDHCSGFS